MGRVVRPARLRRWLRARCRRTEHCTSHKTPRPVSEERQRAHVWVYRIQTRARGRQEMCVCVFVRAWYRLVVLEVVGVRERGRRRGHAAGQQVWVLEPRPRTQSPRVGPAHAHMDMLEHRSLAESHWGHGVRVYEAACKREEERRGVGTRPRRPR